MHDFKHHWRRADAGGAPQQQMPQAGVPVIGEIVEDRERGRAVHSQAPGMDFIRPWFVMPKRCEHQSGRDARAAKVPTG